MKILHVLDHSIPLHSGYAFRSRAILEQLHSQGFETFHLTSAKHPSETMLDEVDGLLFFRTPALPDWQSKLPILNQIAFISSLEKRLREVVKMTRPDLLHVHSPSLNGIAALRIGLPVVYECRAFWEDAAVDLGTHEADSLRYRASRALETRVLKSADALTAICQGLKQDIVGRGIPDEKITLIPNGVNVQDFSFYNVRDLSLRESLGLKDKLVLGFIGSFYAYEGLQLLIEALPKISKLCPEVRLLLVGGGPHEAYLKEISQTLGDRVLLVGKAKHDEVHRYYAQVDIMVYPRLAMRLTDLVTPLKPLEAMALGNLVLASDVGGHKELLKGCAAVRFFKAGNKNDLADQVLNLLRDFKFWPRMRGEARRFVETQRTWQASCSAYPAVYERALRHFNAGKP